MTIDHGARVVADGVRLTEGRYDAFVLHAAFLSEVSGEERVMAVLGDGTAVSVAPGELAQGVGRRITLDAVAIVARPDADGRAMLVGTDDGRLIRIAAEGTVETLWAGGSGWTEQIATHAARGLRALAQGRSVRVIDGHGAVLAVLDDHPSTPTGLGFSPDGGEISVSHYDGLTVWTIATASKAHALHWHGSHTGLAWSPDGRYIVTAMQDKELHCWRMPQAKGMRMSGYPAKIRSLSWTADSAFIVASGADTVTSWPCAEGGPAGRPPLEFGYVFNGVVTRVAAHPSARRAGAGYDEGTVLVGEIETGEAIIARPPGGGAVTALSWLPDGNALIAGTERGSVALMELDAAAV